MKWIVACVSVAVAAFVLFIAGWMTGLIPTAYPTAGVEAVLIQRPILFGQGGVVPTPVKTGRRFVAWTTQVVYVDMRPQQHPVRFDDFMSRDGVPLDFDAVIRLQVVDSVALISKFGPEWYERNVEAEFANRVRQAVREHGMNETAIETTAIDAIDRTVSESMEAYLEEAGLPVRLVQVTVGRANPPDAIKSQRIETATQQQRQMTEHERKLAEDGRLAAEQSRAAADNAYREAMGLNPDQFVELERIHMTRQVCGAEGKADHCTVFVTGNGASPLIAVNAQSGVRAAALEAQP